MRQKQTETHRDRNRDRDRDKDRDKDRDRDKDKDKDGGEVRGRGDLYVFMEVHLPVLDERTLADPRTRKVLRALAAADG